MKKSFEKEGGTPGESDEGEDDESRFDKGCLIGAENNELKKYLARITCDIVIGTDSAWLLLSMSPFPAQNPPRPW